MTNENWSSNCLPEGIFLVGLSLSIRNVDESNDDELVCYGYSEDSESENEDSGCSHSSNSDDF